MLYQWTKTGETKCNSFRVRGSGTNWKLYNRSGDFVSQHNTMKAAKLAAETASK